MNRDAPGDMLTHGNPEGATATSGTTPSAKRIRRAACPGSFDPITNGHLDIFNRVSGIFDELTILVTVNPSKKTMFTLEERMDLIAEATGHLPNVRIDSMSGLLVDYCTRHGIDAVCKGLRVATDFDYEIQMAQMNHKIAGVETLFLTTNPKHSYISSSLVKEVARYGGDVRDLIPATAYDALIARLAEDIASS